MIEVLRVEAGRLGGLPSFFFEGGGGVDLVEGTKVTGL